MSDSPLVSIVIPVYRGDPFLKEAIDSCLAQTYPNCEIIVVNDGSDDDGRTDAIAASYGDRIRYFKKENGGPSSALNCGIAQMKGEWFAWLSHDDLFLPEKIEKQIEAVGKLSDKVCVVRCTTASVDENGAPVFRPQRRIGGCFTAEQMMKMHSLKEVGLYGCTLLIHKEIIDRCGGFDETLRAVQDEDYWNKIMFAGYPFLSIPDALVKNRVHRAQATNRLADRFAREHYLMCEKVREMYLEDTAAHRRLTELFTYKQCKEKRTEGARILKKALRAHSGFSLRREMGFACYTIGGAFYAALKKLYRVLIVKKHR